MGDILVIFGSSSDSPTYEHIIGNLDNYELRICSAHRTPDFLDQILQKKYKVVIAGAGLAAHLPGVVASKIVAPIIGVPCESNYNGLDSLLAIIQMPPGIPVLSVGVNQGKEAAEMAKNMLKNYDKVVVVGDENTKAVKKCVDTLKEFAISFSVENEVDENALNINFIDFDKQPAENAFCINVPVLSENKADDALKLLNLTKKGIWVGLNRGENAALAAVSILGHHDKLLEYREKMKQKVLASDIEVNNG